MAHLAAVGRMFASVNTDGGAEPPETPVPAPRPEHYPLSEDTPSTREPVVPDGPDRAELMRFFS